MQLGPVAGKRGIGGCFLGFDLDIFVGEGDFHGIFQCQVCGEFNTSGPVGRPGLGRTFRRGLGVV